MTNNRVRAAACVKARLFANADIDRKYSFVHMFLEVWAWEESGRHSLAALADRTKKEIFASTEIIQL